MVRPTKAVGFELSVSARDDGTLESMYIRFGVGVVQSTREVVEDVLLADYDASGALLGLEILAPVRIADLEALAPDARRPAFRRFVEQSAPASFIAA